MKLSILIPVYNAEAYIERCLNSLIKQSIDKNEYEIIIINDGSTDNSFKIIENFAENHTNVFLHSHKNKGVYQTRNELLKLAKGTYIYFVDADDYLAFNSLNIVLDHGLKNKLDVIGFDVLLTKASDAYDVETLPKDYEFPRAITGTQFLEENVNIRFEIWWYIIRKDFLEASNINFSRINLADVVFTVQLFLNAKKVTYLPVSVYRYFQSEESTMRTENSESKLKIIDNFEELIISFSYLINNLNDYNVLNASVIKSNMEQRRDVFTFFTITKMIKSKLSLEAVKQKVQSFIINDAYPIKSFNNNKGYNTFKHRVLVALFNKKIILFGIVKINKILA